MEEHRGEAKEAFLVELVEAAMTDIDWKLRWPWKWWLICALCWRIIPMEPMVATGELADHHLQEV